MIDLHLHSTASDGTVAPAELAGLGRDFAVMALTDHDNTDGLAEFLVAARRESPSQLRLSGIEFSVTPGKDCGQFHLLGLGFDPADARLREYLRKIVAGRDERNRRMLANFAKLGIEIGAAELGEYANGEVLARPHFAAWLVDHGYAPDVVTAFERYLTRRSPAETCCYAERYRPDPGEVIDVIHAAHGVAVMAHPRYYTEDPVKLRAELRRFKDRGLDGMEAVYQANYPHETVEHLRIARELDLAITAGSDFHGANKPTVTLGMAVDDEKAFLEPLCMALAARGSKFVLEN